MTFYGTWQPRVGAEVIRKDDPRHVGTVVALHGASTTLGIKPLVAVIVWQDNGWRSSELVEDLTHTGDDQ